MESVVDEAFAERRTSSEFGVRRNLTTISADAEMHSRAIRAAAAATLASFEEPTPNSGNAEASVHSAGVTHNSHTLESTSGANKPPSGSTDGKSVDTVPAPSTRRPRQKNKSSGQRSSGSPGQAGGRQQKSGASVSKQPSVPKRTTKAGKDAAPEQNTQPSSKTLQARVDSIHAELTRQRVSSESGAKAYTLLRDLLSYVMRCESRQA